MKRAAEIDRALERHGADAAAGPALDRILGALAREPDPHTTVDPLAAVDVHVADSLAGLVVPELRAAESIADVGAGAGFPGLVLAAVLAHARVDLIEATGRKAAVIARLIEAGGLTNAHAVAARAEDWGGGERRESYGAVTARAVAPLAVLAEYAAPLLAPGGVLVAWKGRREPEEEAGGTAAAAQLGLGPPEVLPVTPYPGSRNRHLYVFRKVGPTPEGYPRRAGVASKRPLG